MTLLQNKRTDWNISNVLLQKDLTPTENICSCQAPVEHLETLVLCSVSEEPSASLTDHILSPGCSAVRDNKSIRNAFWTQINFHNRNYKMYDLNSHKVFI